MEGPISNPINCPRVQKAFSAYLGENQNLWLEHDSSHLLANTKHDIPIMVDQGEADNFLTEQLKPESLSKAAKQTGANLTLRMQPGYDHSYFFIASFINDHLEFHHNYQNNY